MKLNNKEVKASDLISIPNFVEELKVRTGNDAISKGTVTYHVKSGTNKLDYTEIGRQIFIVNNKKAKEFTPGTNYTKKRVSTESF